MWIVSKINNNCALARDSEGQDVVVFGKGIGFRRPPYELTDLSVIERTFYGVKGASLAALRDIPDDVVIVASDIIEYAKGYLNVELNPNAGVTLADHINFAISRVKDGLAIETPLAFDVRHFYPKETRVGKRALTLIKTHLGVELPEAEVANIALHIIDAEAEQGDMHLTQVATEVIARVVGIVEECFGKKIDTESFNYARFVMHLRFLVGRIEGKGERSGEMAPMLDVVKDAYPESFACAQVIVDYLSREFNWACDESETLYLLIYVQRLRSSME